jgi:hypothetical protein
MSDNRTYISILDPVSGVSGDLVLSIQTYDATPNIAFTVTASGVAADDVEDLARKLELSFAATLAASTYTDDDGTFDLGYDSVPVFNGGTIIPTFKVTRTEHVVCVWSQCQFRVKVTSNTWNNNVVVGEQVLMTLADFDDQLDIFGEELVNSEGDPLTTPQKINKLKSASATIVALTRNNFIISSYLYELTGYITGSIFTPKRPVITFDTPAFRTPPSVGRMFVGNRLTVNYQIDHSRGKITFSGSNTIIDVGEPFDFNNEVKTTYTAGYWKIPSIVKEKVVQMAIRSSGLGDLLGVKVLQGGTGRIEYRDNDPDFMDFVLVELRDYVL